MTSKSLFLVRSKENHKRRIWVWIVSMLIQLAFYPGIMTVYLARIRTLPISEDEWPEQVSDTMPEEDTDIGSNMDTYVPDYLLEKDADAKRRAGKGVFFNKVR